MQAKAWIMLRVLLNRFHPNFSEAMLTCLPQDETKALLAQEVSSNNVALALTHPAVAIEKIHYSWLVPAFQKMPKYLQKPLLWALPPGQAAKIRDFLKFPYEPPSALAPAIQSLLINLLYTEVKHTEILPSEYLPQTSLTSLANLTKPQLVELIDFLGIYDLAEEVRYIIDRSLLKNLHTCLSTKQRQFLHTCLHQREKIAASPMEFKKWDGDCKKLENMLHRRGLVRFGKALSGQHPDLIWHITRILDTGRGALLAEYCTPQPIPGVTTALVEQLVHLMEFLNLKRIL